MASRIIYSVQLNTMRRPLAIGITPKGTYTLVGYTRNATSLKPQRARDVLKGWELDCMTGRAALVSADDAALAALRKTA